MLSTMDITATFSFGVEFKALNWLERPVAPQRLAVSSLNTCNRLADRVRQ